MNVSIDPCANYFSHFHSTVYFLECFDRAGNLYVKIGKASNPVDRVGTLATGLPLAVSRLRYVGLPGAKKAYQVEKALHAYLKLWHERGEWFLFLTGDAAGNEHYEYGVKGQLDCLLCRDAWAFEEVDWSKFKEIKQEKLAKFREARRYGKKYQKRGNSSIFAPSRA